MLLKLRQRMASDESGFTLVELLVVMLIIGLLAAIAIPAFFNQRQKAKDTSAKEMARTAETAMETYATDNNGNYTAPASGTLSAALNNIEPSINLPPSNGNDPYLSGATSGSATTYEVDVTSQTGNVFKIIRNGPGAVQFQCTTPSTDGCPAGGDWGH
jgi:type IV pilus assembly protein PilA